MEQKDKQLLLQDLCGRLPYEVKCEIGGLRHGPYTFTGNDVEDLIAGRMFKPYLRPLSSMTEEEKKELKFLCDIGPETLTDSSWVNGEFGLSIIYKNKASIRVDVFDWLNKKMFDYRGLIPKHLAIAITEENNPYKD